MASLLLSTKTAILLNATVGLGSVGFIAEKLAYTTIIPEQLQVGALVSLGLLGLRMLVTKQKASAVKKQMWDFEEEGAKKANEKLLSASYYADILALSKQLEGQIIFPTDKLYHDCRRRAFNQHQRGFPIAIARVRSVEDISKCVKLVAGLKEKLELCVASGCHSSKCMMTGAFVIDMIYLNKASVNPEKMTATVEGGAYLEELDKVLEPYNFATTVGTYPQTGVGGLVLGGGFGHLARLFGFSVDNLLECEVVLRNGDVVVANDDSEQYKDLMWALRGGSGNFGVVTKFTFRVHKLPKHTLYGNVVKLTPTLSSAVAVVTQHDRLMSKLTDDATSAMMVLPGGAPVIPAVWFGFSDTASTPAEHPVLSQAANTGGWFTLENSIKKGSYHFGLQRATTQIIHSGHLYHSLIQFGVHGEDLPAELIQNLLKFTTTALHPYLRDAMCGLFNMGGKMKTNDADGSHTAISKSIRQCKYFAIIEAYWKPEFGQEGFEQARAWAKKVTEIIQPYSNEALRYALPDDTEDIVAKDQAGYGASTYAKLRIIKAKYDPTNFFKNNMNVTPATQKDEAVSTIV